jgi:hypothetical protein
MNQKLQRVYEAQFWDASGGLMLEKSCTYEERIYVSEFSFAESPALLCNMIKVGDSLLSVVARRG